jgi:coronin-1B/1C/6
LGLTFNSDGNIRYFEYVQDKFEFLSEYKSADPQRGVAFLPKRGINTHENEVMRAFKTVNDSFIEPISFIVPRRAEVFQDDIYPPVVGSKPAMSSKEWFDGKEGLPPKIDLGSIYAGEEPAEIPAERTKSPSLTKPSPHTNKEPEPAKEPQPSSTLRGPPPSMKEQTSAIASLASKFTDKDDVDSDEDDSSFEEIPKPVERSERNVPKAKEHSEPSTIYKGPNSKQIEPEQKHDTAAPTLPSLSAQPPQTQPEVYFPHSLAPFLVMKLTPLGRRSPRQKQ